MPHMVSKSWVLRVNQPSGGLCSASASSVCKCRKETVKSAAHKSLLAILSVVKADVVPLHTFQLQHVPALTCSREHEACCCGDKDAKAHTVT